MKRIGLIIGFLAVVVFVLPSLTAQDQKKDLDKAAKKDEVKKDDEKKVAKKDAKKDDEKKDEKKDEEKKKPEKKVSEKVTLVYGRTLITKIVSLNPNSNRELTVDIPEVDPMKVYNLQVWQNQQMQALASAQQNIARQTNFQQRVSAMNSYQNSLNQFQMQMAKRQGDIYTTKPVEIRAAENVRVRSAYPPVEFDDQGFQKKWTKKELEARRDRTGLEGFPVELDALKSGQYVKLYMAKQTPPAKGAKKKGPDAEDPVMDRPEAVMIVIMQEPK